MSLSARRRALRNWLVRMAAENVHVIGHCDGNGPSSQQHTSAIDQMKYAVGLTPDGSVRKAGVDYLKADLAELDIQPGRVCEQETCLETIRSLVAQIPKSG